MIHNHSNPHSKLDNGANNANLYSESNSHTQTWDKRQTLQTFTERTIYDEINKAEAEKYMENME